MRLEKEKFVWRKIDGFFSHKLIYFLLILLSFPIGGVIGFVVGLISVTFIPICCTDIGCHSCFEFRGLVGYEGTAVLGFWIGLFLLPIVLVAIKVVLMIKLKK